MGKTIRPAPDGSGTYAELGEDAVFDSIQAEEITVARPIEETTVNAVIATTEDDTRISTTGAWSNSQATAYIGTWSEGVEMNTSYRFTNLNIPQGATIVSAQLKLTSPTTRTGAPADWQIGFVDTISAVSPTSKEELETAASEVYNFENQDTGTIVESTAGEIFYFPTASTGTTFVTALQSFVDNPSWVNSSAIEAIITTTDLVNLARIDVHHYDAAASPALYPTLIITYGGTTYESVATVDEAETTAPRIVLPDTLYGVVGDTLQLFARGMIEAQDPYALPYLMEYDVTSGSDTVGRAYPRYFEAEFVAADVSTEDFTVTILDNDYDELATKTVDLVVSDTTGAITPATNNNFLCLGDSQTASGQWPTELYRRLTQAAGTPAGLSKTNITFVGDKDMTAHTGTAAYTGNSGWTWNNFIGGSSVDAYILTDAVNTFDKTIVGTTGTDSVGGTWYIEYVDTPNDQVKIYRTLGATTLPATGTITMAGQDIVYTVSVASTASPFISGSGFDFAAWQTRNVAVGTLNAIYVLLGWNGQTERNATPDLTDVRTFLDTLHSDISTTTVHIIGIQVPSPFGGIGTRYDSESAYGQYYPLLRTANNLNIAYQALANEAAYSDWVTFVGMMPQLDAEYMYTFDATAVNTRLTGTTEDIQTNGIHPTNDGYLQFADAVYREFVATYLE